MDRFDKVSFVVAGLLLLLFVLACGLLIRADVRTCRVYFPEVPVLDCAFSSKYQVQVFHKGAP